MKKLVAYSYPALLISKKTWNYKLVMFYAEAGDMHKWCGVYRKKIYKDGIQRMLKESHAKDIASFLSKNNNVIPNSVVIAFNDSLEIDGRTENAAEFKEIESYHPLDSEHNEDTDTVLTSGILSVRVHPKCLVNNDEIETADYKSAYIVDGQHRIRGGNLATPNTYFPVSAFIGITKEDQAFHFIVINRQADKVKKADIESIIPSEIYENLQDRLRDSGIPFGEADLVYALSSRDDSPFYELIDWANHKVGVPTIPKGAIDKLLTEVDKIDSEIIELFLDKYEIIKAIWHGVRRHLNLLWSFDPHSPKAKKSGKPTKTVQVGGKTYENQFLIKCVGVLPALQIVITNAINTGAISISESDENRSEMLTLETFKYVSKLPLELFYCTWKHKSITNDSRISELSIAMRKAISSGGKIKYPTPWFDKAIAVEDQKRKPREGKAKAKSKRGKSKRGGT